MLTETKRSVCEGGRSRTGTLGGRKAGGGGEYSRRVAGQGDVTVGGGWVGGGRGMIPPPPPPSHPVCLSVAALSIRVHKGELSLHIDRLYVHAGVL